MLKKADTQRTLIYGCSRADFYLAEEQKRKAHPNICEDEGKIIHYIDRPGSREKLKELFSVARKGDHVVISSVFSLAEKGNDLAMIRRLRKLDKLEVKVHVVLEPDFRFSMYDDMYRGLVRLEEQQELFDELCVDKDGKYWMWDEPERAAQIFGRRLGEG